MPLNRDFVGRRFSSDPSFVVGREHVREFALAIGDHNPLYHDTAAATSAGYRDVVAPPTFLMTIVNWRETVPLDDPDLGLDFSVVVHGEQRFALRRPVVAGDELVMTGWVSRIRDVATNELVTIDYEVSTTAGELVATAMRNREPQNRLKVTIQTIQSFALPRVG